MYSIFRMHQTISLILLKCQTVMDDGLSIVLDYVPPHFLPGYSIVGHLLVHSRSGVSTKGLSITLHGEVHISWSEQRKVRKPWRRYRTSIHGTRQSYDSYEYQTFWITDHETIIDLSMDLIGGTNEIPAGESIYPFSLQLPPDIPSSVRCDYGHIEYCLSACLERSWAIDWTDRIVIPVQGLFALPSFSNLSQPMEFYTDYEAGCCCCTSEPLKLWCRLQKTGFYPGEKIQFAVRLQNQSDKDIQSLSAQLNQNFTVRAEGQQNWATVMVAGVERGMGLPTLPTGEDFWQGELLIPPCPPTGLGAHGHLSTLISMYYTFNIVADISGWCSANPNVVCDVTIGSLPPEATDAVPVVPSHHQHHHHHHG